jgi:putative transposase
MAIKCIKQTNCDLEPLHPLMELFKQMVNDCIRIGIDNNASTLKTLCKSVYSQLAKYDVISYYKLCAISHAAGILSNRKKSIKRLRQPRHPYATKPLLISCYGFKIEKGLLKLPLGNRQYFDIFLNRYAKHILSDPSVRVRSFRLTADNSVSICYSKEVEQMQSADIDGVDRNLDNLTVGNCKKVIHYDLSKVTSIAENTRSTMRSFKRNDARIRKKIYGKYGQRKKNRVSQLLHHVSKAIVRHAKENKSAVAFEDIRFIRQLYQKGHYHGYNYRSKMNDWSFAEIKRLVTYKSTWEGVQIIQLSKSETRGTSKLCPQCGKKITQADRKIRQLWCAACKRWMDRDVVAAMNISIKGRSRLERSKGLADEAMKGNADNAMPLILRVDASKLSFRKKA